MKSTSATVENPSRHRSTLRREWRHINDHMGMINPQLDDSALRSQSGYGRSLPSQTSQKFPWRICDLRIGTVIFYDLDLRVVLKIKKDKVVGVDQSRLVGCASHSNSSEHRRGDECVENRNIGGVGFLINSTVQHLVDSHEFISPRLAILRLRTKEQGTISIINGYAPTSAATDEEREGFYQLLEETVREEKSYYKFVVGDFNAIVGTNCNGDWRLGPHGCATRNENGERLLDFLSACRLFHGNSMFEKPAKRRWTWESPNGLTRSEIDHILTNRRWSLFDVSVLPSFDTGSDHRLIRAKITLNKKNFKRDTHRPAPHKIPTFKSADLESAIESNTWTLFEDPTEDYDHLVRGLLKCADASRLSQPTTIPRLNAHATALLEKRKAVKLDPNATHLEKVITGKACRVAVKESLRDYRRTKLLEAAETKSSIKRCKRDLNDQRNVMAALKDKEGKMQSSRRAMENIVQQFYTELFRSSTLVPRCPLPPPEDLLPILESEVGQAIKSMKKGTAPGPDNIPADLLRAGVPLFTPFSPGIPTTT
ncbi:hypothetical protein Y032_0182g878 [Ancylostoma ceylanicum]|uniref:Endonuclease/exonuclease/phosphatase domain-containing protein n=1 Tax=Ancylostoma ceylanicum TaxID=53326 RepID=A0A016SS86_9BILA|nr:hypothetical protein Y032_0182g878 [Ancylostoma ceylanicum]